MQEGMPTPNEKAHKKLMNKAFKNTMPLKKTGNNEMTVPRTIQNRKKLIFSILVDIVEPRMLEPITVK
jgi:hypothetical protein